jgi:hypothetical protein
MYAQVIETVLDAAQGARSASVSVVPALGGEEGFCGAIGLVQVGNGQALMITLWECETQARIPPEQRGEAARAALTQLSARGIQPCSITTWEVAIEL